MLWKSSILHFWDHIKLVIFGLLGLYIGLSGSQLFFKLNEGETIFERILILLIFYFVLSAIIGYFNDRFWWSGISIASGAVLLGGAMILEIIHINFKLSFFGLIVFLGPLLITLAGSRSGKYLKENGGFRKYFLKQKEQTVADTTDQTNET